MAFKRKYRSASSDSAGFTLVELVVSMMIVALMLGGIMTIENQRFRVAQRDELARKFDAIGAALYNYRLRNNKLPCPGDASKARTSSQFGLAADAAEGACNAGATYSSNINNSDNTVFGGNVPVRSLGLPDDMAYDPWGNAFTYYVAKKANISTNLTGEYGTFGVADDGKLEVQDEYGNTLSDNIFVVVLSHGPNGHGAYNVAGVRVNAGSTNTAELENCQCTAAAVASPDAAVLNIRMQRTLPTSSTDFTKNFDDTGRFYNLAYFYTYTEKGK